MSKGALVQITLSPRELETLQTALRERADTFSNQIPWLKDLPDQLTKDHVILKFQEERQEALALWLRLADTTSQTILPPSSMHK